MGRIFALLVLSVLAFGACGAMNSYNTMVDRE